MAKVTVKKEQNYTIISNDIFKDTRLSFKAKGLLTTMLSCPPNWNYTIEGLSKISKDGKASIRSALAELEEFGYLERKQLRDEKGSFTDLEYIVYEKPKTENPISENPTTDNPISENRTQLNTNKSNTDELNTNKQSTERLNTDKDNTSINIDGEVHTSFSEKPTARAVTRDEMLLKEKDMIDRFNNICDNGIDNSAICDCVKDGFKMYMQLYEIYFHKVHPILTDKTLKDVCFVLSTITDTEHGHFNPDDIYETDDKGITVLQRMINDHFIREHRGNTNYSITHFANAEYLGKLANRFIEM